MTRARFVYNIPSLCVRRVDHVRRSSTSSIAKNHHQPEYEHEGRKETTIRRYDTIRYDTPPSRRPSPIRPPSFVVRRVRSFVRSSDVWGPDGRSGRRRASFRHAGVLVRHNKKKGDFVCVYSECTSIILLNLIREDQSGVPRRLSSVTEDKHSIPFSSSVRYIIYISGVHTCLLDLNSVYVLVL